MKIGINMNAFGDIDIDLQIRLMRENGFETTFVIAENPRRDALLQAIQKAGIACESLHAPLGKELNDLWQEGEAGEVMLDRQKRSVDLCAANGIPVSVVHLSSGVAPRINEAGYQRFKALVDYADERGVKIAFENQRYLANIAFAFEQFPTAGFCWDVGHEEAFANGRRYMPLFGDRLSQLHVHDNRFGRDEHLIPYDGKIDYERVAASIAAVDYDRSLMLELCAPASDVYDGWTPEQYYQHAGRAAKKLADRVEYYRGQQA
ncbi:MAG: sugar phosphate isomerase/epimerase [Ruminococcaceae bacterium]|nr:sugar phosphate isomerase/epimerase [Oscillospiraceae bacterium]